MVYPADTEMLDVLVLYSRKTVGSASDLYKSCRILPARSSGFIPFQLWHYPNDLPKERISCNVSVDYSMNMNLQESTRPGNRRIGFVPFWQLAMSDQRFQ